MTVLIQCLLISNIICIPQDYANFYSAIGASQNGDTVLVSPGTYRGFGNRDLSFEGKAILIRSEFGPESTIIDLEADSTDPHRAFSFTSGEDSFSVLDGFTITRGNAYGMNGNRGGGIYIDNCSPKIVNCIFSYNVADMGGAIYSIYYGDPIIRNCRIHHNSSVQNGAGITLDGWTGGICEAEISGNLFEYNTTGHSGAGIYVNQCRVKIKNNVIRFNTVTSSTYWGGGGICLWICQYGTQQVVKNNLVYGNQAPTGGGIYVRYDGSNIADNTFFGNLSYLEGGGIYVLNQSTTIPVIRDCIVWGNNSSTSQGNQIFLDPATGSSANVYYCCVEEGWNGTGNISENPIFTVGPEGDFYLSQTMAGQIQQSPCVDAGSYSSAFLGMDSMTTRTDEIFDSGVVDMGFHYQNGSNPGSVEEINSFPNEFPIAWISPDPAGSFIIVSFFSDYSSGAVFNIVDVTGRFVRRITMESVTNGLNEIKIDLSGFSSGIYYFQILTDEDVITGKILILN
ncbi:T9SS type A sorting domain-containing protein [candidate division WOR-3 bacterium]|nr:T9SS type A sorting domain-containing protein [candidate division WOR-3 bacterium]